MRVTKWGIILVAAIAIFFISFNKEAAKHPVTRYYDSQLDSMLRCLHLFRNAQGTNAPAATLKKKFLDCRNAYKKIEFFTDVFSPYKARQINGPDLLKIDADAPADSIKPHGLQTIEAILYSDESDRQRVSEETTLLIQNISQLRNDPDRIYYFSNDRIWEALQLGTFRIISLGITGFDAPLSNHSLPEARSTLSSIRSVIKLYKKEIPGALYKEGDSLFTKADIYLQLNNNFNRFDRLTFIRSHLNKISAWITICARQAGYINDKQLTPLTPDAPHLFAANIMNLSFFSPNERYQLTPDRIALGKRLFFDTRLSGNGKRSCASCHQPEKAFTDGLQKPTDLSGNKTLMRNTPTLLNAAFQKNQFYDSRALTLETQLSAVVHDADEMNGSLSQQVEKLTANKEYAALFRQAYPENIESINEYNIANAISCYTRSLISLNSRFDRYMRRQTDSFTASEKNGFNLFMGKAKCGTCHYAPVFNGLIPPLYQESESEILAVPATDDSVSTLDTDPGKGGFTKVSLHKHAFKTPTVRNIALTAPYMHNGVFKTLESLMRFYNDGGGTGRGIQLSTQTLPRDKLGLTKKEMNDVITFLHALTDTSCSSY